MFKHDFGKKTQFENRLVGILQTKIFGGKRIFNVKGDKTPRGANVRVKERDKEKSHAFGVLIMNESKIFKISELGLKIDLFDFINALNLVSNY